MSISNSLKYKYFHKELRNNSTKAEKILWNYLKNSSLLNLKFRRQQGIGNYIVDFYCPAQKLVIELDGDSHYVEGAQEYDHERSEYMKSEGIKVLRFTNHDIYDSLNEVLEEIKKELK